MSWRPRFHHFQFIVVVGYAGWFLGFTKGYDLGTWCWGGEFTHEACCRSQPPPTDCFDNVVYTEEACCGTDYASPDFPPDEMSCQCSAAAEDFLQAAQAAVSAAARRGSPPRRGAPPGGRSLAMPPALQAEALCSRLVVLQAVGLDQPCPAAALAGHALCAHAAGQRREAAAAAAHAQRAALAAAALARRRAPYCRREMYRLVDPEWAFSEAEAVRNSARLRASASTADAPAAPPAWQREWKPQLGARTTLDDIALRYGAGPAMRAHQKQLGCSGGDVGQDGNFYSSLYARLFDHDAPRSRGGPSRFRPARVLELGVCDGFGVAVWAEYFGHEDSRVVALDRDFTLFDGNRVTLLQRGFNISRLAAIVQGDASALDGPAKVTTAWGLEEQATTTTSVREALRALGPFDFVRDDASHVASQMVAAFEALFFALLRPGGVYVIEDTWSYPFDKDLTRSFDDSGEFSYFFRLARDAVNLGWRYDGTRFTGRMGAAWIQSPFADAVEAWVDSVEFARGQIVIRKRHQ